MVFLYKKHYYSALEISVDPGPGPGVIKLEFILKLKIMCNDWLLGDMCPQAANHCTLF